MNRKDVAGGVAKQMVSQHRRGGAHQEKRPNKKRFGGKEKRLALKDDY
jgi:hypothetical protein